MNEGKKKKYLGRCASSTQVNKISKGWPVDLILERIKGTPLNDLG